MSSPVGRTYRRMFFLLALFGFLADQTTKYGIFAYLYNDGRGGHIEVIHDLFNITADYTNPPIKDSGESPLSFLRTISGPVLPQLNHGALFGIGNRNEHGIDGNSLFTLVSLVAAVVILIWANRPVPASDRFLAMSLGLVLAGTLGNLYDRVVFGGVRDFLHFFNLPLPLGLDNWPVFNIADCCLVCGASLLVLQALFTKSTLEKRAEDVRAHAADGTSAEAASTVGSV